jgi:hypothetical protein
MITTYERGKIEGRRETALLQLEAKFGSLSPEVKQLTAEQLGQVLLDVVMAQSPKELHLEG